MMNQKSDSISEQNTINYRFKLLYALGMIFIVAGHSSYGGFTFCTKWFPFYGFHVELFAFCSGYLYKPSYESTCLAYIGKKCKSLILPLYVWNILYGLLVTFLSLFGFRIGKALNPDTLFLQPIWNGHQFAFNMGGWFVISLFIIEVLNVLYRRCLPMSGPAKEILVFVTYILLGLAGNALAIKGYTDGWWLVPVRFMHLIPFWGFGMLYKNVLERHDKVNHGIYFSIVALIQLGIIFYLGKVPTYVPSWCRNFVDGPVIPILYGFTAIAFWLKVAEIAEPALGKSKLVLAIADNSFAIMIHQFAGFMLLKTVYALFHVYAGAFSDFDWNGYKTNIWYLYYPGGYEQTGIFYIVAGLMVPILLQKLVVKFQKAVHGCRQDMAWRIKKLRSTNRV